MGIKTTSGFSFFISRSNLDQTFCSAFLASKFPSFSNFYLISFLAESSLILALTNRGPSREYGLSPFLSFTPK
ncbi:hypothetical protein COX98_01785 [Candidatus Pacearchaeota archaeon CG_4_10_14_0_2_um_filter_30_11]|nr:MAG: hypothetical protein COX98_01785 [Candidatus Pacearchaeota archaeon CG_4_10_14_0_2_um_filter_30_11]